MTLSFCCSVTCDCVGWDFGHEPLMVRSRVAARIHFILGGDLPTVPTETALRRGIQYVYVLSCFEQIAQNTTNCLLSDCSIVGLTSPERQSFSEILKSRQKTKDNSTISQMLGQLTLRQIAGHKCIDVIIKGFLHGEFKRYLIED